MTVAALCLPNIVFMIADESMATLQHRWDHWVSRDATVCTRKIQAEDAAGVSLELLWARIVLRPALIALVAIAEPMLAAEQTVPGQLLFKPFIPWSPLPPIVGARVDDDDPDTIWLVPRELTVEDF